MAFKRNYRMQRTDRDRAQKARNEEKLRERQERAEKRKSERDPAAADADSEPSA